MPDIIRTAVRRKNAVLPPSTAPRGLSRMQAAEYVGIGATLFDAWVDQLERSGRKVTYNIHRRKLYDRHRLDAAIEEMLDSEEADGDSAYAPARQAP